MSQRGTQARWRVRLLLALACIPLFFLNIHDTHDWGDDWAQYVLQARNIGEGKPYYESGYVFNPHNRTYAPPQYPIGYSLLLAPVVKVFGLAIRPMLYLNAVFLSALLFALYAYFRQRCSVLVAVCLSLIGVYNPTMLELKRHALSDLPCLLFVAVYLAGRYHGRLTPRGVVLLIFLSLFAILIRTQAILLPLAEGVWWIGWAVQEVSRRRSWRVAFQHPSLALAVLPVAIFLALNTALLSAPSSGLSFYANLIFSYPDQFWQRIGRNLIYLQEMAREFFWMRANDAFLGGFVTALVTLCIAFGGVGWVLTLRRAKLRSDDVFFALMCMLILVTPVYQGARYFLPALPVLLFYLAQGLSLLHGPLRIAPKKLALFFTAAFFGLSYDGFESSTRQPSDWTPNTAADTIAFAKLQRIVPADEIILFTKPRTLTLYTGLRSMNLAWDEDFQTNKTFNDSLGIRYLLHRRGLGEVYFTDYLNAMEPARDSIPLSDVATLYRFQHSGE